MNILFIIICVVLSLGVIANLMFTCFVSKHFDKKLTYLEDKIIKDLIDTAVTLDKADEELDRRMEKLESPEVKPIPIFPSIPPIEC